jgi:Caspase domain
MLQSPVTTFDGCEADDALFQVSSETLALVVGVSDYANVTLNKVGSRADAERVATALTAKGSKTSILLDNSATRLNILKELDGLASRADSTKPVDAIFYYSGHGVNLNGRGYLTAYDTITDGPARLEQTALGVEGVRAALDRIPNARRILFLDVPSTNPFISSR